MMMSYEIKTVSNGADRFVFCSTLGQFISIPPLWKALYVISMYDLNYVKLH